MAEILPLRAWRYAPSFNIEHLTSPLFDVVSAKQIKELYAEPYNSIHLSVPAQGVSYAEIAALLEEWKQKGILQQEALPTIYAYYQYFSLPGNTRQYCRKGFICYIKAYDWEENVVLRHENTIPHAVNDRIELLAHTELNAAPTHGLYSDSSFELEAYLDEAIKNPVYETEDYQGVRDVMALIQDAQVIRRFMEVLKDKKVILADGHHRYTGSLEYRKQQLALQGESSSQAPYNYHLMYLTNTEADDLRILPTHRLLQGVELEEEAFVAKLSEYFYVKPISDPYSIDEVILGKAHNFGVILPESAYKIKLKEGMLAHMTWNFPEVVKSLDLTVLHYFVIEMIFGIKGKEQRASRQIQFSRSLSECIKLVGEGKAQVAFITQDIPIEKVKEVCASGHTLPQKSTYFYPKVICGFLFGSIKAEENQEAADRYFQNLL
jgi:uncharacterized protein (DUF1015 family)